jgi:hypothetical protein
MSFGMLSSMQMASAPRTMGGAGAQALDRSGNQYRSTGGQMGGSGMGTSAAGGGGGFSAGGMMSMMRVK